MSDKRSLCVVVVLALLSIPLSAAVSRGDFEDRLLAKARQRRQAEAADFKQSVNDSLARASELSSSAPERALNLLQGSLSKLRADELLPREERKALIQQVQDRMDSLKVQVAARAREAAPEPPPEAARTKKEPPRRAYAPPVARQADALRPIGPNGGAEPQTGPVRTGGMRYVRISVGGIFTVPPVFSSAVSSAVVVPDRGSANVAGYSSLAEGRNEFGPPGLSQIPYVSRLFRNIGYGRQQRSFRLNVSARIISMQEEEERFLAENGQPPANGGR